MKLTGFARFLAAAAILIALFSSCRKDIEDYPGNANFALPELTVENTIQFTVTADSRVSVEVILWGNKLAVDWGDGTVDKRIDPKADRPGFAHTYNKGTYRVKIWTDELSGASISGILRKFSGFSIGECPQLNHLNLDNVNGFESVSFSGCPKLTNLQIGSMDALSSIDISGCADLETFSCFTLENICSLDIGKNKNLTELSIDWLGIETISMAGNPKLTNVTCASNKNLTNIDFGASSENIYTLDIYNNSLASVDLSGFTNLRNLNCSNNLIASLDLSQNKNLSTLKCNNNKLETLDIETNKYLKDLVCYNNKISAIKIVGNQYLSKVYIGSNQLDANTLNDIFTALPAFDYRIHTSLLRIQIEDNPGTDACDRKILQDKYWNLYKLTGND